MVIGCRDRRADQVGANLALRLVDGAGLGQATEPQRPPRREAPRQAGRAGHGPGVERMVVRAGGAQAGGQRLAGATELRPPKVHRRALLDATGLDLDLEGLVGAEQVAVPPSGVPGQPEVGVEAHTRFHPPARALLHGHDDGECDRAVAAWRRLVGDAHGYGTEQLGGHQPLLVGVERAAVEGIARIPRPVGRQVRFMHRRQAYEPYGAKHGVGARRQRAGHRQGGAVRVRHPFPSDEGGVRVAGAVQSGDCGLFGLHDRGR